MAMLCDKKAGGSSGGPGVFNVEDYGAIPADYYTDGVSNASTTFTSASAGFKQSDVGKWVCLEKCGASQFRRFITTIASVQSATSVTLASATGRSQTAVKFYVSRGGNALSAFQRAGDACELAGGGVVESSGGFEFGAGSFILGNKVYYDGKSREGSLIFQQGGLTNQGPIIRGAYASQNGAQFCGVSRVSLDGNTTGNPSANATTTLSANYTAGNSTIDVTSAASFTPSGFVRLTNGGTTVYAYYTGITTGGGSGGTDRLTGVVSGQNGFADASVNSAGSSVMCFTHCGIYFSTVPYANSPTFAQSHDPYHVIEDVAIARIRGTGIGLWSQSEIRVRNATIYASEFIGITYSFDTFIDSVTVDGAGYAGFIIRNSIGMTSNCKSFSCGTVDNNRGPGFLCQGTTAIETGSHTFSACIAQDNFSQGFKFLNAQRVVLTGCSAASNSAAGVGSFAGVTTDGCTNSYFQFTSTEDGHNGATNQLNAIEILNTSLTSASNTYIITHGPAQGTTVGTAIKSGSVLTGGHQIIINGADYFFGGAFTANDHGLQACSCSDPAEANQGFQMAAGVATYHKVKVPHDMTISSLKYVVTQAGTGGGAANGFLEVFNSAGTRIGTGPDQAAAFATTGEKTVAITVVGGQSLSITGGPNAYVWVGVLLGTAFAGTQAQLRSLNGSAVSGNFNVTGANMRAGSLGAGLSALPSSFTPGSLTASAGPVLVGFP